MKNLIEKWQEDEVYRKLCHTALVKGKAAPFTSDFYDSLTTTFAGATFGEKLKAEITNGKCYFYSLLLAKSLSQSTLIIGALNTLNSNVRNEYIDVFGHGWVEKDGLVYDTTARQIFDKDFYYKTFDASVKEAYKSEELEDPHLFFRLGINAVKDRSNLVKPLFEIVNDKLEIICANVENVRKSLDPVFDPFVIAELNTTFNLPIKKHLT